MCLGGPIISLLYQHGRFNAEAARQTGAALQYYAIGLAAYSGIKVLAPAFYALDLRKTPMMVSFYRHRHQLRAQQRLHGTGWAGGTAGWRSRPA